jgi:DNA-binding PadR family transcriptional regulator
MRHHVRRGDVRGAVLLLLAEERMHGYQIMQTVADRTGGSWRPSPGVVYPTISQLAEEGLIAVVAASGRNLASLTDAGRRYLTDNQATIGDPFGNMRGAEDVLDLRASVDQIQEAARAITRDGSPDRLAEAERILSGTRRSLYLLLAEDDTADG